MIYLLQVYCEQCVPGGDVESSGNECEETRQERMCVDRVIMITIAESSR